MLCGDCGYTWFGLTAAHGLSIIGRCPRCGGGLHFRDEFATAPPAPISDRASAGSAGQPSSAGQSGGREREANENLEPSQVLGAPTSWAR
ncbi:MAG TPA: hypothetical protein VGN69_06990 [Solirubrobacteraceae bacterium]|nr:hypothetical protein [Solirubrobacteraceae bacterium]